MLTIDIFMAELNLEIFNQKLKIKSELPQSKSEAVLQFVQKIITDVELRKKFKSSQDILMIALLELSNEYLSAKSKVNEFQKNLSKKIEEIEKSIEKNEKQNRSSS